MYLGASHCIFTFLALATFFFFFCWAIHVRGIYIFFALYVSCFNCLLIYIYECILFTCIFHTCGYAFCLVFQEIYRLIQLNYCLHLQLMDGS